MLWKELHVTRQILKKITKEIRDYEGAVINNNTDAKDASELMGIYLNRVGYIRGLKYIFKLLDESKSEEE
jgi:hypothetical protein